MAVSRAEANGGVAAARHPGARGRAFTAAGLLVAAAVVLWLGAPICPTALFLGVPCPGCGLTRATLALLSGDVGTAFRFHPLAPILAPLFVGAMLKALFDYVRGPVPAPVPRTSFWTRRAGMATAALLFALVLGVWLLRFAGYFGGPVPVESLSALKARLVH